MKIKSLNLRNLVPVVITAIILSSCSKDKTATPEGNLTGTWTAGTPTYTVMIGTKTLTQYFTDVMGLTAAQAQLFTTTFNTSLQQSFAGTIQMKSDKTYTSNLGGQTDTGTWSLSADAKKLTITSNTDGPETFDVLALTSTKLQLQVVQTESEDLNGDNIPETIKVNLTLNFTK